MIVSPLKFSTEGGGASDHVEMSTGVCGRIGYTGPTGRTEPSPDPSDPTAYCTHTSLAQLLASSSLLVEVILASSLDM